MNKLTLLVLLVLGALVADITIHALPVHAQSSNMAYIDVVHRIGKQGTQQLTTKGSVVVAFSCANTYGSGGGVDCFVLSK